MWVLYISVVPFDHQEQVGRSYRGGKIVTQYLKRVAFLGFQNCYLGKRKNSHEHIKH